MKRPSKVLKFLAAGLLFACGNAFSEKPVFSECPCWDSEPGLLDAIVALGETTCVESLVYTKDGGVAKNWLLRTVTPPETVCFQFELTSSPDISTNGCVLRVAKYHSDWHCYTDAVDTAIFGLSEWEVKNCVRALKETEKFLSDYVMCD